MRGNRQGAQVATDDTVERTAVEQLWQYALGRRRTFLVDRRYQLRVTFMGLLFVVALLIPLNLSVYFSLLADTSSAQAAPELERYLRAQDWTQFLLIALASAVFLLGHFTISIIETHRTAGAAFAIRRRMESIEQGRFGATVQLREDDNLVELAGEFNQMSLALKDRAAGTATELDALAERAAQVRDESAARELASRLRVLAANARDSLV